MNQRLKRCVVECEDVMGKNMSWTNLGMEFNRKMNRDLAGTHLIETATIRLSKLNIIGQLHPSARQGRPVSFTNAGLMHRMQSWIDYVVFRSMCPSDHIGGRTSFQIGRRVEIETTAWLSVVEHSSVPMGHLENVELSDMG